MIPKVIHYCWFGGNPLPELAKKCIASWKKYCPDYEIIEWNESNYDISTAPLYVREAYEAKKWAFVSDYVRFDIIYKYGGVYFDTDVEVIKPIDELLKNGAFMGREADGGVLTEMGVNAGLGFAAEAGDKVIKEIAGYYNNITFLNNDGSQNLQTVVQYVTRILEKHGLQNIKGIQTVEGITIYPKEYLCPMDYHTGVLTITGNTYTVHHFAASWLSEEEIYINSVNRKLLQKKLPPKAAHRLSLVIGFSKYRGVLKMPISIIKRKKDNKRNKNNEQI